MNDEFKRETMLTQQAIDTLAVISARYSDIRLVGDPSDQLHIDQYEFDDALSYLRAISDKTKGEET